MERLSSLIKGQIHWLKQNEEQLKKIIYEISLKQLNEMDGLLRDFFTS